MTKKNYTVMELIDITGPCSWYVYKASKSPFRKFVFNPWPTDH